MPGDILGMNSDNVFAIIILLMLIILGVVTFHFYTYATVGSGSVFNAGSGIGFKLLPTQQKQM